MGKVFVIDVGICNGCYSCQIACKDEHVGNDWAPIAKSQPNTGHFWMFLEEHIRGTVPKVKMHYIPKPQSESNPLIGIVFFHASRQEHYSLGKTFHSWQSSGSWLCFEGRGMKHYE